MKYIMLTIMLSICALSACSPDLQVVNTQSYCHMDEKGYLIVSVRNAGNALALDSKTCVTFENYPPYMLDTPSIAEGGIVILEHVYVPPQCWDPDCSFQITVDCNNEVKESNEDNNHVVGTCIG